MTSLVIFFGGVLGGLWLGCQLGRLSAWAERDELRQRVTNWRASARFWRREAAALRRALDGEVWRN